MPDYIETVGAYMTDDDLMRWEAAAKDDMPVPPENVLTLIAEVRRLRRVPADTALEWAGLLCDACRWHVGPAIAEMLIEMRRLRATLK